MAYPARPGERQMPAFFRGGGVLPGGQDARKKLSTGRAVLDVFQGMRAHASICSPKNVKGGNLGQSPSGAALQVTRQAVGAPSAWSQSSNHLSRDHAGGATLGRPGAAQKAGAPGSCNRDRTRNRDRTVDAEIAENRRFRTRTSSRVSPSISLARIGRFIRVAGSKKWASLREALSKEEIHGCVLYLM